MAHVVTERCVDCRYTDCCAVCPVDCFYEIASPAMLVIDPDVCIDCGLCVPECPVQAIWPEDELPEAYSEWLDKNGELFGGGTMIKTKKDALPGAFSLSQLQARERERGFQVTEPSDAAGEPADTETESVPVAVSETPTPVPIANPVATPEGLTASQVSVFEAAANTIYRWRTVRSVARQVRLAEGAVQGDFEKLVELGHIQKRSPKTDGVIVYGAVARVA